MENGTGTMIFQNKEIYVGEMKEGKMNGYGTLFKNNGKIKQGYWKNNKPVNQF